MNGYTRIKYQVEKDEYKGMNMSLYEIENDGLTVVSMKYASNQDIHDCIVNNLVGELSKTYKYIGLRFE